MSTNKIKELLKNHKTSVYIDIEDIDYLYGYLKDCGIDVNCSLIELGLLYNKFSEECWSASWEDNAEGQFIEWLKDKEIVQVDKDVNRNLIDVNEMQELILDSLFSEETDKYFSNTTFKEEERSAFTQGMVYASILSAVKCKKYSV